MLVLGRSKRQQVKLTTRDGTEMVVTVLAVDALTGYVRLGFDAPKDVRIVRTEIEGKGDTNGIRG